MPEPVSMFLLGENRGEKGGLLAKVVYEDGKQLRDYVNVSDIAKANVLVMEREEADFQVFNAGGGRAITVLEFAQIMLDEFNSDLEPQVSGEFRMGDTRHTVSDISKLEQLGWKPTIPVEQNVSEYVEWIRQQSHTEEYFKEAEKIMKQQNIVMKIDSLRGASS